MEHSDDELELLDKCYHTEMLRLWEEISPNVKINDYMDEVDQEMEPPVCIFFVNIYIYKAEKPSVCLSVCLSTFQSGRSANS